MKHTSFISQSSPSDILNDLNGLLEADQMVDHEYVARKHKVRAYYHLTWCCEMAMTGVRVCGHAHVNIARL